MQVSRPPALATGIVVFLLGAELLNAYKPWHLTVAFNLTALSMWPMAHPSLGLFIVHVTSLVIPLGIYEHLNGTVHTGVVLNVSALFSGLFWLLLMFVANMASAVEASTWGSLSWALTFLSWTACEYHLRLPRWRWIDFRLCPVVILSALAIVVDVPRLLSYAITMSFGYLLYYGYLTRLVEPPSPVIEWIESRITPVISGLSFIVAWNKEVDARLSRRDSEQQAETTLETV